MKRLRAGALEVFYENGFLRHMKVGTSEVIRMIYFALRDENWGTYEPIIKDEVVDAKENSFIIRYNCFHTTNTITVFRWNVLIEGHVDGSIKFEIKGTALENIRKNRAGLCVLHPIKETIGEAVEITHADGLIINSRFPRDIDSENPFKKIKAMRWVNNDHWYSLTFHGDLFETEDQRNWTDASFKTFCTPLDLPFPVQMQKGDMVNQKVIFTPDSIDFSSTNEELITITKTERRFKLPAIGIGSPSEIKNISIDTMKLLKQIPFCHYRIEVKLNKTNWNQQFNESITLSKEIGLPLEIVLHLPKEHKEPLDMFFVYCKTREVSIKSILLLTEDSLVTTKEHISICKNIKTRLGNVHVGAGTDFNFTEINRNRFNADSLDFISYSIHPQEHAFDDLSLVENLEGQAQTVKTARHIYPDKAIHVSPVTLKRRFNPYAIHEAEKTRSEAQRTDPRQLMNFCAVWTLGSIKHLTEAGTSSLTYYQTFGLQGIISEEGHPFPVYYALKLLFQADNIFSSTSSNPLEVDALVLDNGKAIAWNYTSKSQEVSILDARIVLAPYEHKVVNLYSSSEAI